MIQFSVNLSGQEFTSALGYIFGFVVGVLIYKFFAGWKS